MNLVIIEKSTNRLLASISDKDIITSNDVEVIDYGTNSPIFQDIGGTIYVKENSFEINMEGK